MNITSKWLLHDNKVFDRKDKMTESPGVEWLTKPDKSTKGLRLALIINIDLSMSQHSE